MWTAHDFKVFLSKFGSLDQSFISIAHNWFSSYKKIVQRERDKFREGIINYLE